MPTLSFLSRDRRDAAWKLVFELIVIFLGVYAAFWVDNYQDQREEAERSREIAQALQRDMGNVIRVVENIVSETETGLNNWEQARARGESPPPYYYRIRGSERPPNMIFNAILQSRPAELFDSELLFDLGYFYSELLGAADRYVRYATFTETKVLPGINIGSAHFYTADGEQLLPEFAAHMDRLRELREFWKDDLNRARELKARLETYTR